MVTSWHMASLKETNDASGEWRIWRRGQKQALEGALSVGNQAFYPLSRKRGLPGFPAVPRLPIADSAFARAVIGFSLLAALATYSKPCMIRNECSCSVALCRLVISNPAKSHLSPPVPFPLLFPTIAPRLGVQYPQTLR